MNELTYDNFIGQYSYFIKNPIIRSGRHKYGFVLKNGTKIFFRDGWLSDANRGKMGNILKNWRARKES